MNPPRFGQRAGQSGSFFSGACPRTLDPGGMFQPVVDAIPCPGLRRADQARPNLVISVIINALTKSHGLPGLRVGWAACRDRDLLARMGVVNTALSGCLAVPSEVLAHIAIQAEGRILGRNRALAEANLNRLRGFFAQHASLFDWDEPAGGVTAFPRYRGADGVEAFAEGLARQAGVLVLPGSIWRSSLAPTPVDRFRVGFGRNGVGAAIAAPGEFLARRYAIGSRRVR
jgi:aspartate/methionine/tyrosine aminotransferase